MRRYVNGTGAKEQCDLRNGVVGDVRDSTLHASGIQKRCTQNDVGELADGRERQPRFQIVLAECEKRCSQDRHRSSYQSELVCSELAHRIQAKNKKKNTKRRKNAGLHNGYGMQQRAHRSGRHHGRGQPAVQRHERVLRKSKEEEGENDEEERGLLAEPRCR